MIGTRAWLLVTFVSVSAACASGPAPTPTPEPSRADATLADAPPEEPRAITPPPPREPVLPPQLAMLAGLMPLRSSGADTFRVARPNYDGRGVVIAILDSGIDAGVLGLGETTTGDRKILDLRDFSGEGRVPLTLVRPASDGTITIGRHRLQGFGRVARVATPPFYGGVFREITLGTAPEGDINGNGRVTDELPLLVARSTAGWVLFADTDGDGSLAGEPHVRDFAVAGEVLTFRSDPRMKGPITVAANLVEYGGQPLLDLFLDNSSHGTHVAGIAAGHNLFGVQGFDGVAPGAWLLGLKISNNTRGGISMTGSMLRALNYAAVFAEQRGLPLVINLSFGVGNEQEGAAAIDSVIDEFALKHPDVLVVISAGNDGPGLSTVGFPGSAERALSVCALFPGVFARPPQSGVAPAPDMLGWWSGRGGEVAKPDVCAPGVAFSSVPQWRVGEEVSGGTSMAAPHVSGVGALLLSAMKQQGRTIRAVDLKRAMMATAKPISGATVLDAGAGVVDVLRAYRWLLAAHQTGIYEVRALGEDTDERPAAFRRTGLRSSADTLQRFVIRSVGGQPAARLLLEPDAPWLRVPSSIDLEGRPETVTVRYDALRLQDPGLYVGTVWASPATDTIAGPSLALVNSVVVPHAIEEGFETSGSLAPGELSRFFLSVPSERGGFEVTLEIRGTGEATLYLYEPSGQPFRDQSSITAGDEGSHIVTLRVSTDDLVSGVYEAVVVAPPTGGVRYSLTARLPEVVIATIDSGPRVVVQNPTASSRAMRVEADLVGAVQTKRVTGKRSGPVVVRLAPPRWASRLVVDVAVPPPLWHQLTDFGVTVFDSTGRKVSDSPLNYAFGRHRVELDSSRVGGWIDLELLPGFAHLEAPETWDAEIRIIFELATQRALHQDSTMAESVVELSPYEARAVAIPSEAAPVPIPEGFDPLIEVRATLSNGGSSVRRGASKLPEPALETP